MDSWNSIVTQKAFWHYPNVNVAVVSSFDMIHFPGNKWDLFGNFQNTIIETSKVCKGFLFFLLVFFSVLILSLESSFSSFSAAVEGKTRTYYRYFGHEHFVLPKLHQGAKISWNVCGSDFPWTSYWTIPHARWKSRCLIGTCRWSCSNRQTLWKRGKCISLMPFLKVLNNYTH